ncbi:MAG: cytochrome bd-I oxidase subunit CydX [Alphaproteobacteria bacterium]|nr:cytochrome bd-I oxidase subunit CydX [Alphaproteobacteria bacterium]
MWYFSWALGVSLVCVFSVLNALWYEINEHDKLIIKLKKD